MLEMGVLPPVAAASAACMIMYTSAAASAAYYVFGVRAFWGVPCVASTCCLAIAFLKSTLT